MSQSATVFAPILRQLLRLSQNRRDKKPRGRARDRFCQVKNSLVSRANDCARNYLLRARVTRDANDVTPICPTISLRSRGNQYNDAFLSSVKLLRSARTNRDPRTRESIHHQ